jgi:hypothetical protein
LPLPLNICSNNVLHLRPHIEVLSSLQLFLYKLLGKYLTLMFAICPTNFIIVYMSSKLLLHSLISKLFINNLISNLSNFCSSSYSSNKELVSGRFWRIHSGVVQHFFRVGYEVIIVPSKCRELITR